MPLCSSLFSNIKVIDDKVRTNVLSMFENDSKVEIWLPASEFRIPRGLAYGIAFGIRNINSPNTHFSYSINAVDLEKRCWFNLSFADSFIVLGKNDKINIFPNQTEIFLFKFNIPKNTSFCNVKYLISVKNGDTIYYEKPFFVEIREKSNCD